MLFKLSSSLGLVAAVLLQTRFVFATVEPRSWEPFAVSRGEDFNVQQTIVSGPVGELAALSHAGYATLKHAAFPRYSVRVKKSKFCDGTVEYVLSIPQLFLMALLTVTQRVHRLHRRRGQASLLLLLRKSTGPGHRRCRLLDQRRSWRVLIDWSLHGAWAVSSDRPFQHDLPSRVVERVLEYFLHRPACWRRLLVC